MKITIVGIGYVGLSNAILLAKHNKVTLLDIDEDKVKAINERRWPLQKQEIEYFLKNKTISLHATTDSQKAYSTADFVVIAIPTDFINDTEGMAMYSLETTLTEILKINPKTCVIIKSTVPIGFTRGRIWLCPRQKIIFFPEFLRETTALFDVLFPSRLVVGVDTSNQTLYDHAKKFISLIQREIQKPDVPVMYVGSDEAEAIKLYSNFYLATRVAFFNELDTTTKSLSLNTKQIIRGVCEDPRIGLYYNNPSFGYGGYCLPKDTSELRHECDVNQIPQKLISAVQASNYNRKTFICDEIMKSVHGFAKQNQTYTIGIYRLAEGDDLRNSIMQDIYDCLAHRINGTTEQIIIYEPCLPENTVMYNAQMENNLYKFKKRSTLIVANRYDDALSDVMNKVYTRDNDYNFK